MSDQTVASPVGPPPGKIQITIAQPEKKVVHLTFSYLPIAADFVLRWAVLELWVVDWLSLWVFLAAQFVLIPASVLGVTLYREEQLRAKHRCDVVEAQGSGWSAIFTLFVVVTGVFVVFSLFNRAGGLVQILLSLAAFGVYGFYNLVLYFASVQDIVWRSMEYDDLDGPDDPEDANDLRIAIMETEIHSISHRIEAYTLESALFGALAFSGFTTLISSEKPIMAGVHELVNSIVATWNDNAGLITAIRNFLSRPVSDDTLFAAITVETLVCAMFFLLVIGSRLRFYSVLKKVEYGVKVARAWNTKEEEALNIKLQGNPSAELQLRLERLTRKVGVATSQAEPLLADLITMARYMWVFRTLGVVTFMVILTTSAFLLSNRLALAFIALATLGYSYARIAKWVHDKRSRNNGFFAALHRRRSRASAA